MWRSNAKEVVDGTGAHAVAKEKHGTLWVIEFGKVNDP